MPAFSRFLRYFMAVGRNGSIRRAAEELNISASSIDRQILQAEAELGIPLFDRLAAGLRLTAAGEIMMAAGSGWEKELAAVRGRIEDLRGLRRGHVEIAVIDALASGYVPRLIHRVQEQFSGITVSIRVLENLQVRDAIFSGEVDFGIFLEPQTYRNLVVRSHCTAALGFVTLPGHPLAETPVRRFSAGVGYRMVVPVEPLAVCEQVEILRGATGVTLDVAASSDNVLMIKSLVQEGLGVGILTSLDVVPEVESGALRFVAITDRILRPMTLALCTSSSRTLSYAANLVLAEAETNFARLGFPHGAALDPAN
jgi:DNA-binding transcriptional LysR family regulator